MIHEVDENLIMALAYEASQNSSNALSILTGENVVVETGHVSQKRVLNLPSFKQSGDVYLIEIEIKGDIPGIASILLDCSVGKELAACLTRRNLDKSLMLDELSVSALKETGNILLGSFLTVLADNLDLMIVEHLPQLTLTKREDIPDIIRQHTHASGTIEMWSIEMIFRVLSLEVQGELVLVFDTKYLTKIVEALNKPKGTNDLK